MASSQSLSIWVVGSWLSVLLNSATLSSRGFSLLEEQEEQEVKKDEESMPKANNKLNVFFIGKRLYYKKEGVSALL